MTAVPFFDLARAVAPLSGEVEARWRRLLAETAFVGGAEVAEFESRFAGSVEAVGCVGVANGTDALVLALRALGLALGDEVVVPAYTFVATAAAVVLAGGRPVFADVEPSTLNIDVQSLSERLSERTVGVIGVHLYGRPFAVDAVVALCQRQRLWLLEDAAQAHGARWRGRPVGTFGRLATWSFYPAKNLGCFGDGGAVTGNDAGLLELLRRLANHGRVGHYEHAVTGTNSRLDALQAAVLNCRLGRLEEENARRRMLASKYRDALTGVGDLELLEDHADLTPVYHQMTVLTDRRDALQAYLRERGIGTAVHYPKALHLQPAFQDPATSPPELPVAGAAGGRVLCLPIFPQLTEREVDQVIEAVVGFYRC